MEYHSEADKKSRQVGIVVVVVVIIIVIVVITNFESGLVFENLKQFISDLDCRVLDVAVGV